MGLSFGMGLPPSNQAAGGGGTPISNGIVAISKPNFTVLGAGSAPNRAVVAIAKPNYTVAGTGSFHDNAVVTVSKPNYTVIGAGSAPWTPNVITGLIGLYDPNLGITKDGSNNVATWTDQSGKAILTSFGQSVLANKPLFVASSINSQPGIRFNGSTSFMTQASVDMAGATAKWGIFAIFKNSTTLAGYKTIFAKAGNSEKYRLAGDFTTAGKLMAYVSPSADDGVHRAVSNAIVDTTNAHVWAFSVDGAVGGTMYLDNVAQTTTQTTFAGNIGTSTDLISLGCDVPSSGVPAAGDFANFDLLYLAIVRGAITSNDRTQMQTWAHNRFNI